MAPPLGRRLVLLPCLLLLLIEVTLVREGSTEQFSWQPQGRFGKRAGDESLEEIKSALSGVAQTPVEGLRNVLLLNGRMRLAEEATLRSTDGAVCLRTAQVGHYRCLRVADPDPGAD